MRNYFFMRSRLVAILTLLISQHPIASTIFRQFRYKKKHLVSTTLTLLYCTPAPKNSESHKNRKRNPRAYIPIKTHIYITINKKPLPTKPIRILVPQIHDQINQNIHLPVQQKLDTQTSRSYLNWGLILSSHQRFILCSQPHQNL